MSKDLNVLYTCDDNYAPFSGISMCSLFENNRDLPRIRVFLIGENISEQNTAHLQSLAKAYGREVVIKSSDEVVATMKSLKLPEYRNSRAANFRLFFETVITEEDVETLLYLDSDTLVVNSLAPLLEMDFEGNVMAVVQDALATRYQKLVGVTGKYFNSGFLYIDVKRWKAEGVQKQLTDYMREVRSEFCNPDQDVLNLVLGDRVRVLSPAYNFQPIHRICKNKHYFKIYRPDTYYTEEEIASAVNAPVVLHCYRVLGTFPWHAANYHPDIALFDAYKEKSPWRESKKLQAPGGLIFSIERLMYRFLPKRIFFKIFEMITYRNFKKRDDGMQKTAQIPTE